VLSRVPERGPGAPIFEGERAFHLSHPFHDKAVERMGHPSSWVGYAFRTRAAVLSAGGGELPEFGGDALGCAGAGLGARGDGHLCQAFRRIEQLDEGVEQLAGDLEIGLGEQDGGPDAHHFLCVAAAAAKGMSNEGLPAAASSATLEAPLRAITSRAAANCGGISSRNPQTFQREGSAPLAA